MRQLVALALVVAASAAACGFQVSSGVGLGSDATTDATGGGIDAPADGITAADALPIDAPTDGGGTTFDVLPIADASLDAPPNTTPCGGITQACCTNGPACKPGGECNSSGTCASCGNLFESCCDQGNACNAFTACVGGTCVGL